MELVFQRLNYEMVRFNIETKQFEIPIRVNSFGKEIIVQTELSISQMFQLNLKQIQLLNN